MKQDAKGYGNFLFREIDADEKRPSCAACGDDVKTVYHSGVPKYAAHCSECYAELRYGKISTNHRRRML